MKTSVLAGVGGRLYLDECFREQPVSATISINSGYSSCPILIEDVAQCDTLVLDLAPTKRNAKRVDVVNTAGTGISSFHDPDFKLTVTYNGRYQWVRVSEFLEQPVGDVLYFCTDDSLDFEIGSEGVGGKAFSTRCYYDLALATENIYTGHIQVRWDVEFVSGDRTVVTRTYDVVKQHLHNPASWSDVLQLRPDADHQISRNINKDALVEHAWENLKTELRNRRIYHNLIIPDGYHILKDAVVAQTILNLTIQQGLALPVAFETDPAYYLENLKLQVRKALSDLHLPVDNCRDGNAFNEDNVNNLSKAFAWVRR